MKLRGIEFGPVLDASGVRGWFGEGYLFHKLSRPDLSGSTFVAKTTTVHARDPYSALTSDGFTVKVLFQKNVIPRFRQGVVLNSLGLPGPGVRALLARGEWQRRRDAFFLSFMAVEPTLEARRAEVHEFVETLGNELPRFASQRVGLQVNYSCPNVEHSEDLQEIADHISSYRRLGIPLMLKLSVTTPPEFGVKVAAIDGCDALCVSNTIPWGQLRDEIDWRSLYGETSPLADRRGGGLSGAPLLPLVARWIRQARAAGLTKPINGGGGILKPGDVDVMKDAGADSIFLGSIVMLRPWNVGRTVRRAQQLFASPDAVGTRSAVARDAAARI